MRRLMADKRDPRILLVMKRQNEFETAPEFAIQEVKTLIVFARC